ncbi:hypothetical protein BMS3Bbin14_00159 [bacterium BMS3Bbin14]|nr:hypothetical protein BMS3Bbin14_00159 [bacterium BMS3Bbin14]
MDRNSMNQLIKEEFQRIPHDSHSSQQNELRNFYKMRRQRCLSSDPNQSPAESFAKAVEDVRKRYPEFEPNVTDPAYFGWSR